MKGTPDIEEMYSVLFRIVRTWQQRQAVGHDLVIAARSIIRRATPDAYADLLKRWPDTKASWHPERVASPPQSQQATGENPRGTRATSPDCSKQE